MNEDETETMRPPVAKQVNARREHQIERAMLFARRQAFRDVLAMVQRLQATPDWAAGFSVFRDWAEQREAVQSRGLEQARTGDGRVPDELREAAVEADALAMLEEYPGVGHSVIVECAGKRAVFVVTGRYNTGPLPSIRLEPQVDP